MSDDKNCNLFTTIGGVTQKQKLAEDSNGRTNILIFGTSGYEMSEDAYDGAFLTDSMMVLSVDQTNKNAYMISLPRDLWVKHDCTALGTTAGKLNEAYYCGYADSGNTEKGGVDEIIEEISAVTGLSIQYHVHADWTALIQLVNAVGGVDVKIDSDDPRGIYDVATQVKYPNGTAHLDGERALALARSRNSEGGYGLAGGNFDREHYQREILTAIQQKALSTGTLMNLGSVNSMLDALGDNMRTDVKTNQIQTIIDLAKNISSSEIKSLPLVNRGDNLPDLVTTGMVGASSVVMPTAGLFNYTQIQSYIAQNLSSDPVVREGAVIDVLNGSETAGVAQDVADELERQHYQIGEVTNAPTAFTAPITIYQLTDDKPKTAAALAKKYGVELTKSNLDGWNTTADFVIVLGDGYSSTDAN
jgi:LCP family protein required for cell wall assembly